MCVKNKYNSYASTLYIENDKVLDLEIMLVKHNIQYDTNGAIYIITIPNTKESIKYSITSGRIYINKKWYAGCERTLYALIFYKRK